LQAPLWFVINHWRSDRSGPDALKSRDTSWTVFSQFFHNEARLVADPMIVCGDFNCEPSDAPFANQVARVLEPTRERERVLRGWRDSSYLYNPMWRFMGEVDAYEDTLVADYQPSRLIGTYQTHSGAGWRMVDQMFVTKSLLTGAYYRLLERTLRICLPKNACSDHCALGASFMILEGT
jgi:endonuclease/exonuclease/phosphatase family metal-dependent hydrolase